LKIETWLMPWESMFDVPLAPCSSWEDLQQELAEYWFLCTPTESHRLLRVHIVIRQFANYYVTGLGDFVVVILLAGVLLIRPQGLLGKVRA
ncbi:MAG: hypothetical protein RL066_536, partial [Actinomycetota bacterium]